MSIALIVGMHHSAMNQRFPNFVDAFFYNSDGHIIKINDKFTWNNYDYNTIASYILELAHGSERQNLEQITDVKNFIRGIYASLQSI